MRWPLPLRLVHVPRLGVSTDSHQFLGAHWRIINDQQFDIVPRQLDVIGADGAERPPHTLIVVECSHANRQDRVGH